VEHFRSYLLSKRIVPEKKLRYYLSWITRFYAFYDKSLCDDVSSEEIDGFLGHLMKSRENWQVSQANEAIRLYTSITNGVSAGVKQMQILIPTLSGRV
jgi:hypothetical protein